MSETVTIVPGNPLDLRSEDLAGLVTDLARDYVTEVRALPQHGYGVTWWEVLLIYVGTKGADALVGHAYQVAIDRVTEAVKEWRRQRRGGAGGARGLPKGDRPLFLGVLDDEGNVVRALELQGDEDVKDVTERERAKGPRPRPAQEPATEASGEEKGSVGGPS